MTADPSVPCGTGQHLLFSLIGAAVLFILIPSSAIQLAFDDNDSDDVTSIRKLRNADVWTRVFHLFLAAAATITPKRLSKFVLLFNMAAYLMISIVTLSKRAYFDLLRGL
jgi:hypothetical protein